MAGRILIADDSASIREIAKLTLQFKGYEVIEAKDGREAYETLSATDCDLLITDLAMPNMSGAELLNKIRVEMKNETLPIIVCTAEEKADRGELLLKGANAVVKKPFSPIELMEKVEALLR